MNTASTLSIVDVSNTNRFGTASSSGRGTLASASGQIIPTATIVFVAEKSKANIVKVGREKESFCIRTHNSSKYPAVHS
jgi:hypothetical protein